MKLLTQKFTDALLLKCQGDMSAAAAFIDDFPRIAAGINPAFREVLRRGMFLILKAHIE